MPLLYSILMKQLIHVLFVLLLLQFAIFSTKAQNVVSLENVFFSAGFGANTYINDGQKAFDNQGFQGEISAGLWILNPVGCRIQLTQLQSTNALNVSSNYTYGHFDFLWNPVASFLGYNPYRWFDFELLYGVGVTRRNSGQLSADNDFALVGGLACDIGGRNPLRAHAELKTFMNPPDYDDNLHASFLPSLSIGINYDLNYNPYRARVRGISPNMASDWYFSFSVLGVNSLQYRGVGNFTNRLKLLSPSADVSIGKCFSTIWGGRLQFLGIQVATNNDAFAFANIHADLMLNLSYLVAPQIYMHRFSVSAYGGAGLIGRTYDKWNFLFSVDGGLFCRYILSYYSDVFLVMNYTLTPPRFADVETGQSFYSVGIATVSLGYIYNIGKSVCRIPLGEIREQYWLNFTGEKNIN